ncbi:hypothetical protein CARUB_v10025458mg [Capsella rubella]|uniref:Uncharacterized protein n=1 Tax=Capsella rubella TaxID=81985 RepID=R0G1P8_9BRAS|nr:hypothetical protein CARUB_v10025458mg [Capsella rubella]
MDRFESESEEEIKRSRRIFFDVPRRKRSRRTTPKYKAPPSSPTASTLAPAPALASVATRLNGLRQDETGMSGSSTGSCSSTGSNSMLI